MHIQRRVVCQRVEHIHRLDLTGGEWRNIRQPARRFDVLPLIDRREQFIAPVEDRDEEVRFLSGVHFSAPVSFDGLEQYFARSGRRRRISLKIVTELTRLEQPARFRRAQAEQRDYVTGVRVKGLPFACLVDARVRIDAR